MRLQIRSLNGEEVNLEVQPTDTIQHVKSEIQKQKRILLGRQRLLFNNNELQNDRTLSSYNINNNTMLQLMLSKIDSISTIFLPSISSLIFGYE